MNARRNNCRLNRSFVKIGIELHIYPNGLQRWRDKFLDKISSLIEYKLPKAYTFSRNKIETLIYVLELIKTYFLHSNKFWLLSRINSLAK
ncbi:MAG: hypothetical protein IJS81_02850 [Selenomonadaceae bacterium]|nr:hypothetical protein [Selenomonadaceae bacterium]